MSALHIWDFFCGFISFHSFSFCCCFSSSFHWRPLEFTRQLSAMTEEKIWAKLISLEKVELIRICLILVICGRTDRINEKFSWPLKPLRSKTKTFSNLVYLDCCVKTVQATWHLAHLLAVFNPGKIHYGFCSNSVCNIPELLLCSLLHLAQDLDLAPFSIILYHLSIRVSSVAPEGQDRPIIPICYFFF